MSQSFKDLKQQILLHPEYTDWNRKAISDSKFSETEKQELKFLLKDWRPDPSKMYDAKGRIIPQEKIRTWFKEGFLFSHSPFFDEKLSEYVSSKGYTSKMKRIISLLKDGVIITSTQFEYHGNKFAKTTSHSGKIQNLPDISFFVNSLKEDISLVFSPKDILKQEELCYFMPGTTSINAYEFHVAPKNVEKFSELSSLTYRIELIEKMMEIINRCSRRYWLKKRMSDETINYLFHRDYFTIWEFLKQNENLSEDEARTLLSSNSNLFLRKLKSAMSKIEKMEIEISKEFSPEKFNIPLSNATLFCSEELRIPVISAINKYNINLKGIVFFEGKMSSNFLENWAIRNGIDVVKYDYGLNKAKSLFESRFSNILKRENIDLGAFAYGTEPIWRIK
ncbi:hypothetical protein KY334_02545 [Candidatus Woesearchaeota archaeon]|nr:hypothetical protein [Candidatus Woesearchaeota archaeon]